MDATANIERRFWLFWLLGLALLVVMIVLNPMLAQGQAQHSMAAHQVAGRAINVDRIQGAWQAGGMLTVADIQQAYRERTGNAVARSTVYRLLERHGWRKVVPRPRHPKADVAAQAAFEKTPLRGTPRGLAPG